MAIGKPWGDQNTSAVRIPSLEWWFANANPIGTHRCGILKTFLNREAHSKNSGTLFATSVKVADVLEREMGFVIHDWMEMVEKQDDVMHIPELWWAHTRHLPQLLRDVITRLRLDVFTKAHISIAASHHGHLRREQGYTVAMMIEESRLIEVCIFTTLNKSSTELDFIKLLPDVVTIVDEVDAQLKQQTLCFVATNAL
jgi:hypothetical protein